MTKHPYKLDQVAIRMVKERPLLSEEPLSSPDAVVRVMNSLLKDYDREVFAVVNLQSDLKPINMNIVSVGTLNASMVHPREVLKSIVLSNAASVLLVHNHISGSLRPSQEDINVTGKLMEVLNMLDVKLLDHVIPGTGDRYYSFSERAVMPVMSDRKWRTEDEINLKAQKKPELER